MPENDALIEALRAAGDLESSGTFSIDFDEAHEKLRRFQLARPQMWLVLLTTAAVAGGASRLDVSTDRRNAVVTFDGAPLDLERLAGMVASLDSEDRRLWDVACALNALSTFSPRRILIQSWDDRHSAWMSVAGDRVRYAQHEPPAVRGSGTRITIASGAFDGGELSDFMQRCPFAPLLVTYNGQPHDPWFEIQDALLLRLIGPPFDFDYRFHTHVRSGTFVQKSEGPFPAIICAGGRAVSWFGTLVGSPRIPAYTWDGRARTLFVLNGQSFEVDHTLPGALCIAAGAGLEKDLSHGALLAGDALAARLRALDDAYEAAVIQVATRVCQLRTADPQQREALLELLDGARTAVRDSSLLTSALTHLQQVSSSSETAEHVHQARIRANRSALVEQRTRLQREWRALRVERLRDLQTQRLENMRSLKMNTVTALELLALLEHADSRDEVSLALTREGIEEARRGTRPVLLGRLLDQAALLCRAMGEREQAAVHEAAASALPRAPGRSERIAMDHAFAEGRVDDARSIAQAGAVKFPVADLDFLDALADACHLQHDHARALEAAERALRQCVLGNDPYGTESVERREVVYELAHAARGAHPPQTGIVHAAHALVNLNVERMLAPMMVETLDVQRRLRRSVERELAGAPGQDPEDARQALLRALHLIREAGAGHLAVMQGTLWLGVRLHRFGGQFAEADRLAASLYLCRRLQAAHLE